LLTLLVVVLLARVAYCADGVIDDTNTVPWIPGVTVGVYGGIPTTRTEWTNLVTAGADPTGVTTCSALLTSLLDACPSNQYVYAPQGTYKLSTTVSLVGTHNHWTLRGAGKTNTVFRPTLTAFALDNNNLSFIRGLVGSIARGATNITVLNTDFSGYEGHIVHISSRNWGRTVLHPWAWDQSDYLVGQLCEIKSISQGTNLVVWPPMYWDHAEALGPRITLNTGTQTEGIGFEDFSVDFTGVTGTPASELGFNWFGTKNCWWKNIRILDAPDGSFNSSVNLFCEVRDSVFTSQISGSGTFILFTSYAGGWLVENNFCIGGSPFWEANSTWGSVCGYNFCTNNVSDDTHIGNPFDHHEPYSMFNLWEGNDGSMFQQDSYHGGAALDTLHRNRFRAYQPPGSINGLPRAIDLCRNTQYYQVIGNVLGDERQSQTYYYSTTNQFYDAMCCGLIGAVIYCLGYPNPGDTAYGSGSPSFFPYRTPETDWRWPGIQGFMGTVTQATALTNIIYGDFSAAPTGNGFENVILQSSVDTNLYFPPQTNYPRLKYTSLSSANMTLSALIWVTNGAKVYGVAPQYFQTLHFADIATHTIEGNYDYTNRAQVWNNWTGTKPLSNSLYRTSQPSWWRPSYGSWPPFDPSNTNSFTNLLTAAADYYYPQPAAAASGPGNTGLRVRGVRAKR